MKVSILSNSSNFHIRHLFFWMSAQNDLELVQKILYGPDGPFLTRSQLLRGPHGPLLSRLQFLYGPYGPSLICTLVLRKWPSGTLAFSGLFPGNAPEKDMEVQVLLI